MLTSDDGLYDAGSVMDMSPSQCIFQCQSKWTVAQCPWPLPVWLAAVQALFLFLLTANDYKYAYITNADSCQCSNTIISSNELDESMCQTTCPVKQELTCGGPGASDLYDAESYKPPMCKLLVYTSLKWRVKLDSDLTKRRLLCRIGSLELSSPWFGQWCLSHKHSHKNSHKYCHICSDILWRK